MRNDTGFSFDILYEFFEMLKNQVVSSVSV